MNFRDEVKKIKSNFKTFIDLDANKDESFQIEDLESLDEESAESVNKKLEHSISYLRGTRKAETTPKNSDKSSSNQSNQSNRSGKSKIFNLDLGPVKIPIDLEPLEHIGNVNIIILLNKNNNN